MLGNITLKCSNCGANLQITNEMSTFACGYCGASQMVERSGGTISLKLLTNAISKVQVGTDKTAAELALRRLSEELAQIELFYNDNVRQYRYEDNNLISQSKLIWIIFSLVSAGVSIGIQNRWFFLCVCVAWVAITALIFIRLSEERKKNDAVFAVTRQQITEQGNHIRHQIEVNRKIVSS
jgi:hypothetical protein